MPYILSFFAVQGESNGKSEVIRKLINEGDEGVVTVSAVLKPRLSKQVMTIASKSFSAIAVALPAQFYSFKILPNGDVGFRPSERTSWVSLKRESDHCSPS